MEESLKMCERSKGKEARVKERRYEMAVHLDFHTSKLQ
jgi:hypothetical protein